MLPSVLRMGLRWKYLNKWIYQYATVNKSKRLLYIYNTLMSVHYVIIRVYKYVQGHIKEKHLWDSWSSISIYYISPCRHYWINTKSITLSNARNDFLSRSIIKHGRLPVFEQRTRNDKLVTRSSSSGWLKIRLWASLASTRQRFDPLLVLPDCILVLTA